MTALFYPEHEAALKQAVYDFVRASTSIPVVWSKQNAPSPPKPFARLDLMVPPVSQGQAEERGELALQLTAFPVDTLPDDVATAVAVTYRFTINGIPIVATVTEDADPSDCQVAILDAIEASAANVSVALLGSDAIILVKNIASDPLTVTDLENVALKSVRMHLLDGVATFMLEAVTDDDSAAARAKEIELGLDKATLREALNAGGWGTVNVISWRTPSEVVGAKWEQRAGFDLRLRCKMRSYELLDFIETAEIDTGIIGALTP